MDAELESIIGREVSDRGVTLSPPSPPIGWRPEVRSLTPSSPLIGGEARGAKPHTSPGPYWVESFVGVRALCEQAN